MKDRIFLIWSGDNTVAMKVKRILEVEHNYICYVGGDFANNHQMVSIGDTVISEMHSCNQAIVLFKNKANGTVSNNLYFELGFVSAEYGMKKVHCVRRADENIVLPSDFDNSFVEPIEAQDDDSYAQAIVDYFLKRQKLSIDENKIYLINNRYTIHEMLQAHYSKTGSKCSDYELAQYILYYTQSGVMYQDEADILKELRDFKRNHYNEFSEELNQAVNLSIGMLEVQTSLKSKEDTVYIDDETFRRYFSSCKDIMDDIRADDSGLFDEWARAMTGEHLSYACGLYAANPENDAETRASLYKKSITYATQSLENFKELENLPVSTENNDRNGLIPVYKSYLYRELFMACKEVDKKNAEKYLNLCITESRNLIKNFDECSIDSKIYNSFEMDYYVNLVEFLGFADKTKIDEFDYKMYLKDIDSYISRIGQDSLHAYINKIINHRNKL